MSLAPTPSQTVGPFFRIGATSLTEEGEAIAPPEGAITIRGTVFDGAGAPVPDAMLEIWAAGAGGEFGPGRRGFARALTDDQGGFRFSAIKPGALGDGQAPHIDMSVFARGLLQRLVTRIYFPDEAAANEGDPVLASIGDTAARSTLVAVPEDGSLRFDVRLQGEGETVFFEW